MFGVGLGEIILIAVVALIFIGPQKLPDVAKQMAKLFVQLRRVTTDVRSTVDSVIRQAEEELRRDEREALRKKLLAAEATKAPASGTETVVAEQVPMAPAAQPAVSAQAITPAATPAAGTPPSAAFDHPLDMSAEDVLKLAASASTPANAVAQAPATQPASATAEGAVGAGKKSEQEPS